MRDDPTAYGGTAGRARLLHFARLCLEQPEAVWPESPIELAVQLSAAWSRASEAERRRAHPAGMPAVGDPPDLASLLAESPGIFATLTSRNRLRGCIGRLEAGEPLAESIPDYLRAASREDPRFAPVARDEYPFIVIELSLLSPRMPVRGWQDIELGRHGILLSCAGRRAVFLPQVPGEQGWDLATTLSQLSRKAGLDAAAWRRDDAGFEVFTAEHFRESP